MQYSIIFSPAAEEHFALLTAREAGIVFDSILASLQYEPLVESRNRKPMKQPALAEWELRVGNVRVYYRVDDDTPLQVDIIAIGIKDRNQVKIGGKVVDP